MEDSPAETTALSDRERELVQAVRDYLAEIEQAQAVLLRIARRALSVAIADLEG